MNANYKKKYNIIPSIHLPIISCIFMYNEWYFIIRVIKIRLRKYEPALLLLDFIEVAERTSGAGNFLPLQTRQEITKHYT